MQTPPPTGDSAAMREWVQVRDAPYLAVIFNLEDDAFTSIQLPTSRVYSRLLWNEVHRRLGLTAPWRPFVDRDGEPRGAKEPDEPAPSEVPAEAPRVISRAERLMSDWL